MKKNLKKLFLCTFVFTVMTLLLCFNASALNETGYFSPNVLWNYNSETKELIISGEGKMVDKSFSDDEFTQSCSSPFYKSDIRSVVIKPGITKVGANAFRSCENLTTVIIPESVTVIGGSAFEFCTNLQNIVIPDNVTTIGTFAFRACTSLQNVVIPESVTTIEYGTFASSGLKHVAIPDSVTKIEDYAFASCKSLQFLTIGDNVASINDCAFSNCTALESVIIPDSVVSLGSRVFYQCTGLKSVTLGNGISRVYGFNGCSNLKYVTISNSATQISSNAFVDCTGLESIVIPNSVTLIGDYAFKNCTSLKDITIGKGLTSVSSGAFQGCKNITDVYYKGTKDDWDKIKFKGWNPASLSGLDKYLLLADIHFHTHWYDNDCDKDCNVCKATRKITHSYKTTSTTKATLSKNGKVVSKCSVCSASKTTTVYYPKTIKLSKTSFIYNGKVQTPSVTVKDSKGNTLKKDTDYTVKYSDGRKNIGTYTVTITFKGKYTGSKKLTYTIVPNTTSKVTASQTTTSVTLKWNKVTGATGYRIFQKINGKWTVLTNTTKLTYTVKKLKAGTKYSFSVRPYTVVGKTTILAATYTQIGTATKTATPALKVSSSKKGVAALSWTNVAGETGYQVYYSTKKDSGFKKYSNFKANTTSGTVKKLTSGKTYYFKVRSYIKTDSGYVYSPCSEVKSVKVK